MFLMKLKEEKQEETTLEKEATMLRACMRFAVNKPKAFAFLMTLQEENKRSVLKQSSNQDVGDLDVPLPPMPPELPPCIGSAPDLHLLQ